MRKIRYCILTFSCKENNNSSFTGFQNETVFPTGSMLINSRGQSLPTLELNKVVDEYSTLAEDLSILL
jgi:hypothetical protein